VLAGAATLLLGIATEDAMAIGSALAAAVAALLLLAIGVIRTSGSTERHPDR
jgi:4-amino-4-deoxy-L-arabinose transferase-like glycosyltransferase